MTQLKPGIIDCHFHPAVDGETDTNWFYPSEVAGREKILFGTDFPINNPAICVEGVRFESLSDQDRDAILRDNFLRLIQESEA